MQKTLIYTSAIFCALIGFVACHSGISYPNPRGIECSATVNLNFCGKVEAPCGGDPVGNKTKITYGKLDVGIFQKEGHNGGNVYKIQIAESETGPWTDLTTQNQEDGKDGISITIPTTIPTSFPSGNAVIRMIFDATNGGGDVYYSCADVALNSGAGQVAISLLLATVGLVALLF